MKNKLNLIQNSVITLSVLFSVFSLIAYFCQFNNGFSNDSDDWSSFGSYFGGTVNTSLTIIALIYIFKTYNMQLNSSYISSFESNLFKMIDIHNKITDRILSPDRSFYQYKKEIDKVFQNYGYSPTGDGSFVRSVEFTELPYTEQTNEIIKRYDALYTDSFFEISHYFRSMYNIFKYIDEDKYIQEIDKKNMQKLLDPNFPMTK